MKRMYSLDVLKLLLAFVIAFHHAGYEVRPDALVTVQIFFLISGFFLGKKFYTRKSQDYNPWDYTLDHVKQLYPNYLFSGAILSVYLTVGRIAELMAEPGRDRLRELLVSLYYQIPEVVFLQSAVHPHSSVNYPLWQLSALLVAGYFVFGLLCRNEKQARLMIFPAAILMIQSLLNSGVGIWDNYGPFYIPLLRAFSPLCIGVLTYYFTTTRYWSVLSRYGFCLNAASLLAIVSIVALGGYDVIYLITAPVVLLACCRETSWINAVLNHRVFRFCGKLSYGVYLNHALVQKLLWLELFPRLKVTLSSALQGVIYVAVLTAFSALTLYLVDKIQAARRVKAAKR